MTGRTGSWDDHRVEALLAGHGGPADADLQQVLRDLGRFSVPVPQPSAALAAVLSGATSAPAAQVPSRTPVTPTRWRRRLVTTAALAVSGLGVATAAVAANTLPAPAQQVAARILDGLTPFDFPSPHGLMGPHTPATVPSPFSSLLPLERATSGPSVTPEPTAHKASGGTQDLAPTPARSEDAPGQRDGAGGIAEGGGGTDVSGPAENAPEQDTSRAASTATVEPPEQSSAAPSASDTSSTDTSSPEPDSGGVADGSNATPAPSE